MIKTDMKQELKELYRAGIGPTFVDVPEMKFLMVDGKGNPNLSQDFQDAVGALYSVSYGVKFALKKAEGANHTVMPLEGLWWAADMDAYRQRQYSTWEWTLMIAQPAELTADLVKEVTAAAWRKRQLAALWNVRLETFREGRAAQVLHVGPYATEASTIDRLDAFVAAEGYVLRGRHHEIYLGDPRRSAPERLKTIIRHPVAPPR
jgi:hypothetical protein